MITVPHSFSELRIGPRPPSLLAGAGLSWGLVPGPTDLLNQKRAEAEDVLKLDMADLGTSASMSLYEWAGIVIDKLTHNGDPTPRLSLAKALGLLTEPCWTAGVGLPLRGT